MKITYMVLFATAVMAFPHRFRHGHMDKRSDVGPSTSVKKTITIWVDGDGKHLSSATAISTTTLALPSVKAKAKEEAVKPAESVASPAAASAPVKEVAAPLASPVAVVKTLSGAGSAGIDRDFPDGELDCSHFPGDYGALSTGWIYKDGWSGLQFMQQQANGDIRLATRDPKETCMDGTWCSYACPPGYSKAQWPAEQPSSGESIGGLVCKNGKLWLTRSTSRKLCTAGADNTKIVNNLGQGVAICRTDYPGTENMVVPTWSSPNSEVSLTVPYQSTGYEWQNKKTSAQFYVNNRGVSVEEGCVWGQPNGGKGNWAPMNFGASVAPSGETFVSLFQNPLNLNRLDFNVKIVLENGKIACKYEDGEYYGPEGNILGDKGCTAAYTASAKFIFY